MPRGRTGKFSKRVRAEKPRKSGTGRRGASKRRAVSVAKKIEKHTQAVETVGRKNVKRGPKLIGTLGKVTPDKKGIKKLRGVLKAVDKAGPLKTFSYSLIVRDRKGRILRSAPRGHILKITKRQKQFAKRRAGKGKQTALAKKRRALKLRREEINEVIRGQVFANLPMTDEIRELYREFKFFRDVLKDEKEANAVLKEIQELRGVTFDVEIYREI